MYRGDEAYVLNRIRRQEGEERDADVLPSVRCALGVCGCGCVEEKKREVAGLLHCGV